MNLNSIPLSKEKVFTPIKTETADTPVPKKIGMKFHEAVRLIEGREFGRELLEAKHVLEERLRQATDHEERAMCHFYLLRLLLSEHIFFENQRALALYQEMLTTLFDVEKQYKKEWRNSKSVGERKLLRSQIEVFYQLVDGRFAALEAIYEHKSFASAKARVHEDKMRFRKRAAHFSGRHFAHLGHLFLEHTTRYGNSFVRWGITVLLFILFFGGTYALLDAASGGTAFRHPYTAFHPFDYIYFSLITIMTVGYGDIAPLSIAAKFVAGTEAILGYVMLGILLTLIQKRL